MGRAFRGLVPILLLGTAGAAAVSVRALPAEEIGAEPGVAVIVNPANNCPDPTLQEVHAILTLQRQFWKDGRRIVLILPASGSFEKSVLLEKVYRRTDAELRKDWARRLFAGEIPAVPTSLRSADALFAAVRRSPGAIAIVPASAAIPPGVRVLAIEGKRPGQPGYPLSANGS